MMKDGSRLPYTGHHVAGIWPTDLNGDGKEDLIIGCDESYVIHLMRDELSWE